MQGRKRKPTVLADLHGRPSKDKAPPREPQAVTGDLSEAPDFLSDAQRAGWRYAIEHAPPGLLKRIDKGALMVWIVAEDLHRQATIAQNKMPLLVKVSNGPDKPGQVPMAMQSPYLPIINRQGLIMLKAASELGFSPVSRPRVGLMPSLPPLAPNEGDHAAATQTRTLDDFLSAHPQTQH